VAHQLDVQIGAGSGDAFKNIPLAILQGAHGCIDQGLTRQFFKGKIGARKADGFCAGGSLEGAGVWQTGGPARKVKPRGGWQIWADLE
jgi:hypothetical protein